MMTTTTTTTPSVVLLVLLAAALVRGSDVHVLTTKTFDESVDGRAPWLLEL